MSLLISSKTSNLQLAHTHIDSITVYLTELGAAPVELLATSEKVNVFMLATLELNALRKIIPSLRKHISGEEHACFYGRFNALYEIYRKIGLAIYESHVMPLSPKNTRKPHSMCRIL